LRGENLSKVSVPRFQGDDYQARWLWFQICRLFIEPAKIETVKCEVDGIRAFDDVAVYYRNGVKDQFNSPLLIDFYQVKFHVTASGAITWKNLIDPAFINAKKVSLLQRLKNAQELYPSGCRFFLYSPWTIHPDDSLASIVSLVDGCLDLERLSEGGDQSQMGEIRSGWCRHLELDSFEELYSILRPLRIKFGLTLDDLNSQLNTNLYYAGLRPVDEFALGHPYDELTRKLVQRGITRFDCKNVEEICRQENLWVGISVSNKDVYRVGIRSFFHWAEDLADKTDELCCLLHMFNNRAINSPELWNSQVLPEVEEFTRKTLNDSQRRYHLWLSTHSSIAFAAGYCLPSKAGIDVVPIQQGASGHEIWHPIVPLNHNEFPGFMFPPEEYRADDGMDVAIAISISKPIFNDVVFYANCCLPQVHRIISLSLTSGTGNRSILNGSHALMLAEQVDIFVKTQRNVGERAATLHIFSSAPNGFLFFLGQLARGFGDCILYEYLFESNMPGAYMPSIRFNAS
jgi:hypothetical protein